MATLHRALLALLLGAGVVASSCGVGTPAAAASPTAAIGNDSVVGGTAAARLRLAQDNSDDDDDDDDDDDSSYNNNTRNNNNGGYRPNRGGGINLNIGPAIRDLGNAVRREQQQRQRDDAARRDEAARQRAIENRRKAQEIKQRNDSARREAIERNKRIQQEKALIKKLQDDAKQRPKQPPSNQVQQPPTAYPQQQPTPPPYQPPTAYPQPPNYPVPPPVPCANPPCGPAPPQLTCAYPPCGPDEPVPVVPPPDCPEDNFQQLRVGSTTLYPYRTDIPADRNRCTGRTAAGCYLQIRNSSPACGSKPTCVMHCPDTVPVPVPTPVQPVCANPPCGPQPRVVTPPPTIQETETTAVTTTIATPTVHKEPETPAVTTTIATPTVHKEPETPAEKTPTATPVVHKEPETPAVTTTTATPTVHKEPETPAVTTTTATPVAHKEPETPAVTTPTATPVVHNEPETPAVSTPVATPAVYVVPDTVPATTPTATAAVHRVPDTTPAKTPIATPAVHTPPADPAPAADFDSVVPRDVPPPSRGKDAWTAKPNPFQHLPEGHQLTDADARELLNNPTVKPGERQGLIQFLARPDAPGLHDGIKTWELLLDPALKPSERERLVHLLPPLNENVVLALMTNPSISPSDKRNLEHVINERKRSQPPPEPLTKERADEMLKRPDLKPWERSALQHIFPPPPPPPPPRPPPPPPRRDALDPPLTQAQRDECNEHWGRTGGALGFVRRARDPGFQPGLLGLQMDGTYKFITDTALGWSKCDVYADWLRDNNIQAAVKKRYHDRIRQAQEQTKAQEDEQARQAKAADEHKKQEALNDKLQERLAFRSREEINRDQAEDKAEKHKCLQVPGLTAYLDCYRKARDTIEERYRVSSLQDRSTWPAPANPHRMVLKHVLITPHAPGQAVRD